MEYGGQMSFRDEDSRTRELPFHEKMDILINEYDTRGWWPHENTFEIMIGAILVQRTRWENVEKALERLRGITRMDPESLLERDVEEVENAFIPSGFYRSKTKCVLGLANMLKNDFGAEEKNLFGLGTAESRKMLLSINGIGQETADTILLYAGNRPVFITDHYKLRLYKRVTGLKTPPERAGLQKSFIGPAKITSERSKEVHSATVTHCQRVCRKDPLCERCVIRSHCGRNIS